MRLKAIKYGAFAVLACACSPSTDSVFGDSPAVRQQQAAARYAAILEGAELGWAMDFYPGEGEYGGIAYTVAFDGGKATLSCEQAIDNTRVDGRAAGNYAAGQAVTSDYHILNGRSVMLSFDTYNPLLHYWSQPSGTDYDGYASDYEFTFVSASPDSVVLRGVKHGRLMRLYPLTVAASDYIPRVADMRRALDAVTRKRAVVDGITLPVTAIESHLQYDDGGVVRDVPYTFTPTGLRFYQPVTMNGATALELTLDPATQSLVSVDGRMQLPAPTRLELFCGTTTQWHFVFGRTEADYDMCDELRTILQAAVSQLGREKFESLADMFIGMNKLSRDEAPQRYVMGWTTSYLSLRYEVCHGIDLSVADEQSSTVSIRATEYGNLFYNYTMFAPVLDFVAQASPYVLTFDSADSPTSVRLTSQADPSKWFTLKTK